jgi:hypothetical protein
VKIGVTSQRKSSERQMKKGKGLNFDAEPASIHKGSGARILKFEDV